MGTIYCLLQITNVDDDENRMKDGEHYRFSTTQTPDNCVNPDDTTLLDYTHAILFGKTRNTLPNLQTKKQCLDGIQSMTVF